MKTPCVNYYAKCRKHAELSQETASELLNVSTRSLSDYENDYSTTPEDILARMSEVYNAPELPTVHMKQRSPLGVYFPDFIEIETHGDLVFLLLQAQEDLNEAFDNVKNMRSYESRKQSDYISTARILKQITSKAHSATIHANKFINSFTKEMKFSDNISAS